MCSLASLLFLRFGLLPLFDPGPPAKKRKKHDKVSKLSKLLRKLAPKGRKGKSRGKVAPFGVKEEEMEEKMKPGGGGGMECGEKAEETWTKEMGNTLIEWTVGGPLEAEEEDGQEEEWGKGKDGGETKSKSTSNLHEQGGGKKQVEEEEEEERKRAQSAAEEGQKGQPDQQEEKGQQQKRRKKSFKICQCIPRAETFEEIALAHPASSTTIVDKLRPQIMSTNSGTRFKIIPVENRYKRGRWQVWDYYEGADIKKCAVLLQAENGAAIQDDHRPHQQQHSFSSSSSSPSSPEKSTSLHPHHQATTTGQRQQTPPPPGSQQQPAAAMPRRNSFQLITIKNLDDRRFSSSVPTSISEEQLNLSPQKEESAPAAPPLLSRTPKIVEPESAAQIDLTATAMGEHRWTGRPSPPTARCPPSSAATPSHQLQMLERSLTLGLDQSPQQNGISSSPPLLPPPPLPQSPSQQQQYFSASFGHGQIQFGQQKAQEERKGAALARRSSSASTGAVPSSAQNAGVAIDSKIEQAMDLVKSHLIYAVRDEIELLRTRIADLETTVLHLEAENAILRDAIPRQVLASICLDPVAKPKPVLAFSSSAAAAIAQ